MAEENLILQRLQNQQIWGGKFFTPGELVKWMGAMQAQDFNMALWAIGSRIEGLTETDVLSAFNRGDIIRTHLLRPTWHIVTAEDLGWILRLTGPIIKRAMLSSEQSVGLTEKDFIRSTKIIEKVLEKNNPMTRDDLKMAMEHSGLEMKMNMPAHYLMHAEISGIICSGPISGNQPTYILLRDWVSVDRKFTREEAVAELMYRYFRSHGPATVRDFSWWSGLNLTDSRRSLQMVKEKLNALIIKNNEYWYAGELSVKSVKEDDVILLPAYDEYIISYKDRSLILPLLNFTNAVSTNGVFRPLIIHKGKIIGTWRRAKSKEMVSVIPAFFKKPNKEIMAGLQRASQIYSQFIGMPVVLRKEV